MYSHRKTKEHQMFLDRLIKHVHKLKKKKKKRSHLNVIEYYPLHI